jgi:hypothetical protein
MNAPLLGRFSFVGSNLLGRDIRQGENLAFADLLCEFCSDCEVHAEWRFQWLNGTVFSPNPNSHLPSDYNIIFA